MLKGTKIFVEKLFNQDKIHGVISLGGAEGAIMAASAMQVLPPGFPKIIVTPLASGIRPFGPFIGIRDIMVMHSLIDIAGLNEISKTIFNNAASAICGMVKNYKKIDIKESNIIAITALGTVQKAVNFIFPKLKNLGYEPIIFHASGVGGQVMEDMIKRGYILAVLDLCTNELTGHIVGPPSLHDGGPERLKAAGEMGIPQLVVPGCVDFFVQGAIDTIPEKWKNRKMFYHNPQFTLIRPSHNEMEKIAKDFCNKLNSAKGPVTVVLPLLGMSIAGIKGSSMYDPKGDQIFFKTLKNGLKDSILVLEENMHVNEEAFGNVVVSEFYRMLNNFKKLQEEM